MNRSNAQFARPAGRGTFALATGVSLLLAGAAAAQTALDDSVLQRPRPDYDQLCFGIDRAFNDGSGPGSPIQICPELTVRGGYTDNVFRTEADAEGDTFVAIEPSLSVRTDGDAFNAEIGARGTFTRQQDLSRNDSDDYEGRAAGRVDITEDLSVSANGSFAQLHEARDDPDRASAALDVTEYTLGREHLAFEYRPVDWLFRLAGEARQVDYRDNGAIENDDRDRSEYELIARAGRNFGSGLTLFVEPTYNMRRYRNTPDAAGTVRDSEGYAVRAGVTYDVTGVTFIELGGGYFEQRFDDPSFGNESGFSVAGRVVWNPSDPATLTLDVGRAVTESTLAGVSAVVDTDIAVGLDYEIRDRLLLTSGASYHNSDFGESGRVDDSYGARLGLIGLINEYMSLTASYAYAERVSDTIGEDFRSNTFLLSLDLQF